MSQDLFESVVNFPDPDARSRYQALVGLDDVKERLEKEAEALLRPDLLQKWSMDKHATSLPALELLQKRPPLFILAGDVGTGKTELAMSFGDRLARSANLSVELYCLSLRTRGNGAVGEMTRLISEAFRFLKTNCPKGASHGKKPSGAAILLIDEADSLAQSRELAQMHHEDRAGVNALIRGIDDIAAAKLPCLIVMCSNRYNAMDPAVCRRSAAVFEFRRPSIELRKKILSRELQGTDLCSEDIAHIAGLLGETEKRNYGYTFSDITQRLIPSIILAAYPKDKVTRELVLRVVQETHPTAPFRAE